MSAMSPKSIPHSEKAASGLLNRLLSRFWAAAPELGAPARRVRFEGIEPRILLSADFAPEAAVALAGGLNLLEYRLDDFLTGDEAFEQPVPLLLKVTVDEEGAVTSVAPKVGDMLTVPVDANGDGGVNQLFFNTSDDDELALQDIDDDFGDGDGYVDAGEFLTAWFFDPVNDFLTSVAPGDTTDEFEDFLKGFLFFNLDESLTNLGGAYTVDFEVIDAQVADLTEDPDAEVVFSVGFQLTVSQSMPIDLGLEADGLKLFAYTGSSFSPESVEVPVTSTLSFGFEFGVFTGGKTPASLNASDFFVRRAEPLLVSVVAQDGDLDFNLNVGFLGAQVVNGDFDLRADIATTLVDPDDPEVLGFVDSQHGIESTTGVVTASNAVTNPDLEHAAGFFLRIGNVGITTPVTVADGNAPDLATLKSHIQAALAAANLDELITADITGDGKVQFALVDTTSNPLGFGDESLDLTGVLTATPPDLEPGSTVTFLLSLGGALPVLVSVRFPDPARDKIGFGETQDAAPTILFAQNAASGTGTIGGDGIADLSIRVTEVGGAQTLAALNVTEALAGASPNASAADLVADLNAAIGASVLNGKVSAALNGTTITLNPLGTTSAIEITSADADAQGALGLLAGQQSTLRLSAANAVSDPTLDDGDPRTNDEAHIEVAVNGGSPVELVIAPGSASGADLAAAIDAALAGAGIAIDASFDGSGIVLAAQDASVWDFSINTVNDTVEELAEDVNRALAAAGLAVTASEDGGGNLQLSAGGQSIEITKTLTFDAGVTGAELFWTPTGALFDPEVDEAASHATFDLPVHVRPGLEDLQTVADDDWDPADVALVANFSPLGSTAAEYDDDLQRFTLHFTYTPETSVPEQDTPVAAVGSGSLSEEVRLVNMAELLNFNLLSAESMIGQLMGLGSALQQLASTPGFAGYDIPFADATLADLLNFTDTDKARFSGLIDRLLFDTGGDGLDGDADENRLLRKVYDDNGDPYLIPNFVTAQELANVLHTVLGVPEEGAGGINASYDTVSNELTYEVDLIAEDATATSLTAPFDYNVDLSPFNKTVVDAAAPATDTEVALAGRTGLEMTFGVDLSPPGLIITGSTPLADLNGGNGVEVKAEHAITGTVNVAVSPLPGPGTNAPTPPPVQQFGFNVDAVFSLAINGAPAVQVTVPWESTVNRTLADLAQDVNNALAAAGIDDEIFADYDGRRLVLSARDDTTTFTLSAPNGIAEFVLGLADGAASNRVDFVITDSSGGVHEIVLDGLPENPEVQDVIDAINVQTGGAVTASFNGPHTGLRLVDNTAGAALFRVDSSNGSGALLGLGFFLNNQQSSAFAGQAGDPYLIEGGALSQTQLDKRFFVEDAEVRIDGLTLETPTGGVPGQALFGIVGVDTTFDGSMIANVTAGLKDPLSGTQVTLAELFKKTGVLEDTVVSKAQTLAYDAQGFFGFSIGDVLVGDSSGATAIVVGVDDSGSTGTLTLSHVKGAFTDDEVIYQSFFQFADANGVVGTNDNFGEFDLGVAVQDGFNEFGFGDDIIGALDGMSYNVPVALTGFGNPFDPAEPVASLDLSGIGDLAAFEHLSYSHLADALHDLEGLLNDINDNFALFNTTLPAINRSVADLLSLVEGFERGVDNASGVFGVAELALDEALDLPPLSLQQVPQALRGAFGLPNGIDPDGAGAVDWVRLDFDQAENLLLLDFSLNESLSTKLGLDIEVGSGLPNLTSGGILKVAGSLDVNLHVGIDLDTPQDAYLFDTSNLSAELHVEGEGQEYAGGEDGAGLVLYSSVGPLAVFIRDGDAVIDVAFSLPGLDFGGTDRKLIEDVVFDDSNSDDFLDAVISENNVDIVLPMFYGGEGPDDFLGEFSAVGTLQGLTVETPDFSDLADDITDEVIPFDPFDNINLAIDTVDFYFETLTDLLSGEVLGTRLPFVGDQMGDFLFIEQFRSTLVRELKNGVANAINPDPDTFVTGLLNELFVGGALDGYLEGAIVATENVGDMGVAVTDWYRQWGFTIGRTNTITIDDFDIGMPGLGFDVKVPVLVTFEWEIDFVFGVNFGDGAYIDVADHDLDGTDLDLDLTIALQGGTHTGELGYLRVDVSDPGNDSGAQVHFDIDVQNAGEPLSERIAFADLGSLDPVATIHGGALDGAAHAASLHLVTQPALGLPTMSTEFILDWVLPSTPVADLDGDAVVPGVEKIALTDMMLDSGSVADALLGPLLDEVGEFIAPFMPVIDTLTAPIPILSDVAGEPFTLLDLAGIFGEVDPAFIETIADILDVIVAIDAFVNAPLLPLGDLILYEPDAGIFTFDPTDPGDSLADVDLGLLTLDTDDTDGDGLAHNAGTYNQLIDDNVFLKAIKDQTLADGLEMPILVEPEEGIKMLLNQVADLVTYRLNPLLVDFSYFQAFPVFGPLSVGIEIGFGFMLDLHEVGFDTFGYQRYADGGFRNPLVIFDGFFLGDLDENDLDAPEISMLFSLVGTAELNLGIARAGVGGGIDATITFDWHDSIADGNVHISEIVGNIVAEDGNPFAAFDLGGELTFELFAFLEILSFRKDIPITGEQTLYKFEDTAARDPVLATDIGGGVLQLNMGPNAKDRLNGDTSDGNEEFFVKYDGGDVLVWSDKLGVSESNAQNYGGGYTNIVGLGGQGNDVIELRNFDGTSIRGDFDGGIGDDRIEYVGSTGSSSAPGARIVGGLGNDKLTGGDLNDIIYGGDGNDEIAGGGGYDILFGDDGRVADTVADPFISSRVRVSDGDDTISGGDGDDVIFGAGGDDTLDGGAGNDVIIGDGGRFEYTMTGGHVDIAALRPAAYVPTPVTTPVDPDVISGQIDAIHDAMLATFTATDFGFGGNDNIFGGDDDDMILGGTGDDTVNGQGGNDIILGGKGFDDLHGGDDDDTMFGGDQADTMAGGAGDDVMSGGRGNDFMHGNEDDDVMKGDSGADVMFGDAGDDQVFGQTEPDILFGGADDDLVVGGTSNDIMFGDDGLVAKLDPADGSGLKVIGIGFGGAVPGGQFYDDDKRTIDLILTDVVAGDGNDIMSGDAGDDFMLGGGGNDLMGGDVDPRLASFTRPSEISEDVLIGDGGKLTFDQRRFRSIETVIGADTTGEPFDDVIYGDNGNDYVFGGRGSDFLFGGHGRVVDMSTWTLGASRGPTDAGASDNDIIVGDNGEMLFAGYSALMPDNFGRLEIVRTTDSLEGTGGHEYVEGELGEDVVFGGVNGGADPDLNPDILLGHEGNDVVLGDNGELDWALGADTNLGTLDLIRSYRDGLGGRDEVSGHAGGDVLIGGTGGDLMYGDDATASAGALDGEDIMLGDNADIFLIGNVGRLTVRVAAMPEGTAVDLITTTDDNDDFGGADTMSGNAKADVMLGGVNDGGVDTMYGDRAVPTLATIAADGDDILLGDNGLLDFTYLADTDRNTLDLIRSFEDGLGGTDVMSGNKGQDVAIGGTGDDEIYGDDLAASAEDADLGDLLLGDNADIFLVAANGASGGDAKLVLDAAVATIRTTDEEHPEYGGTDTISGNAGGDIMAGGVQGDTLYGDALAIVPDLDGDDVILGDNGAFEWLSTGRLAEVLGIDVAANNPALWAKYGTNVADGDLTTLDLITTEQPTSGGRDVIYGDEGNDLAFGGTDLDWIHGDDGDEVAETGSPNRDVLFGDHGRLYPHFSALVGINSRNFFAIDTGDAHGGEGDLMWGEEGDDVMLGQQGDDRMWGGTGDDDMIGGHNVAGGYDELTLPAVQATLNPPMNDLMDGGSGDDAMAGDNTIMWRRGDDLSPRFRALTGGAIYTTGPDQVDTITANVGGAHASDPDDAVGRDIELVDHSDGVQANPMGRFGADVMAGGADSDVMYGQLGNDLMQGDGNIGADDGLAQFVTHAVSVVDSPTNETTETLYFNVPEQASDADDYMEGNGGSDLMYGGLGQDDIIGGSSALFGLTSEDERPDGSDIIFGGAGAPVRLERNDFVGATDTDTGTDVGVGAVPTGDDPSIALQDRHSRDADFIMGDNANVYRLVGAGDAFLEYNYDKSSPYENRGAERIVARAMEQLDYTLGGADYAGGVYVNGAAQPVDQPADNGAGDLIHGESGDDQIFGMTGSDVIFGESDDDDLVGGYGNDWISGGTGQDGVLGDDGLIYTSRNSTAGEPLYGIAGLLANDPSSKYNNGTALNEVIATPGDIQYAVINVTGELKKSADLVPFSFDPDWLGLDDEFPDDAGNQPFADDIIFGGLGGDFLHGGSGDDAISGAEALEHAYVPTFGLDGNPDGVLDLGYNAFDLPVPVNPGDSVANPNPGDVLAFNPQDLDGQHLNNRFRAGEFFLYDEYDPLRRIMLTASGELWKDDTDGLAFQFLLNFDETEGLWRASGSVPKATGQQTEFYDEANDDGKDAIFGDLGNDWLVGGTGRDNLYGGWGNDLLNADDDLTTLGDAPKHGDPMVEGANDVPDTHPFYEDRAYGGAGRDILIGNTGGDRLIDWVGEYNSFLVPYAPFGQASVSRTMMPHLQEFLYALSAGDGADPTRYSDQYPGATPPAPTNNNPIPTRNGEPYGELGMVVQQDFAWGDQTGAPADPQAGNIPGGARDVLRSAGFQDGSMEGFFVDSGKFAVENGVLKVSAESLGGDAVSVFHVGDALPSYFEVQASLSAVKPIAGWKANSYIVFDYQGEDDFKFAGIDVSNSKLVMGHRDASGWHMDEQASVQGGLKADKVYNVLLAINGVNVTLVVDNKKFFTHTYQPRVVDGWSYGLKDGMIGVGSDNSRGTFDNVRVLVLPPAITFQSTDDFEDGVADLLPATGQAGTWAVQDGRLTGSPVAGGIATSLVDLGIGGLDVSSYFELAATINTQARAGFVFDRYSETDFKFAAIDAVTDQVMIGHYTERGGWTVDAFVSKPINGGASYQLGVAIKGSTVSVTLNGQAVLGTVFNAVAVDGDFGLLASGTPASFDGFTVKTDDAAFAQTSGSNMLAAAAAPGEIEAGATLTQSALDSIATVAIAQWTDALGNGDPRLASLGDVRITVADLAGDQLGYFDGASILVDTDAAGHGWFVDVSPAESAEFSIRLDRNVVAATGSSDAFARMDLLTVMLHELGHVIGFTDNQPGYAVMDEDLESGVRYLLDADTDGPTSDRALLQTASNGARLEALGGMPGFDLDGGPAAAGGGSIDWQAASGESWGVRYSPYASGKASPSSAANFSDFLLKLFKGGNGTGGSADGYDALGSELLGSKDGNGKAGGRPAR